MKASFVTLAVAGLAAAYKLEGVSDCVSTCIGNSLATAGCTGTAQEIAVCGCKPETQAKLATPVTKCVTDNKCETADLVKAQSISAAQCKAIGGGSVPGSGNTTGAATTTTMTNTNTGTGNTGTGTTAPTGVFPTNSSNHTTTGSSSDVATGTNTSTPNPTGSQTHTSGQPTSTNGAAVVGPAAGALFALFAAVAAL